jgi:hypothetical protein
VPLASEEPSQKVLQVCQLIYGGESACPAVSAGGVGAVCVCVCVCVYVCVCGVWCKYVCGVVGNQPATCDEETVTGSKLVPPFHDDLVRCLVPPTALLYQLGL